MAYIPESRGGVVAAVIPGREEASEARESRMLKELAEALVGAQMRRQPLAHRSDDSGCLGPGTLCVSVHRADTGRRRRQQGDREGFRAHRVQSSFFSERYRDRRSAIWTLFRSDIGK